MSAETQKQQQQQQALHSGMKRHFYSQHSSTQGNAVDLCRELLLQAATDMPLPSNTTTTDNQANAALHGEQQQHGCHCCCCINVAEWGCSHGANSIAPVALIAEVLQQRLADYSRGACSAAGPCHIRLVCFPAASWRGVCA